MSVEWERDRENSKGRERGTLQERECCDRKEKEFASNKLELNSVKQSEMEM